MTYNIDDILGTLRNPSNEAELLVGLKSLKNSVIGHDEEKMHYMSRGDVVPVLLNLSDRDSNDEIKVQTIVILGSFAYGSDMVIEQLLDYPVIPAIQKTIERAYTSEKNNESKIENSNSDLIIRSCLKILSAILQSRRTLKTTTASTTDTNNSYIANHPGIVNVLNELLSNPSTPSSTVTQCCKLVPLLVESSRRGKKAASASSKQVSSSSPVPSLAPLAQCLSARISMLMRQYQQQKPHGVSKTTSSLESAIAALANILTAAQARTLLTSVDSGEGPSSGVTGPRSSDKFIQGLVGLTRDDNVQLRLSAVELLTKLQEHAISESQRESMIQPLLPTLVPILDERLAEDPRVSLALARICRDDEDSASMAVEVGVVKKICSVLKSSSDLADPSRAEVMANNLLALAGIGAHKDKFRSEITDNGGLGVISRAFSLNSVVQDENSAYAVRTVKTASCYLLRSLSRSVSQLRTSLSSTEIVDGIMEMLQHPTGDSNSSDDNNNTNNSDEQDNKMDEDINIDIMASSLPIVDNSTEVRSAVMAAICNLILEFSPLQKPLIDRGLLNIIVEHAHSPHAPLRLNSVWALKHATFSASQDIKDTILSQLGSNYLMELCHDPELEIQEQAMAFMRNLVCRNTEAVDRLFGDLSTDTIFAMIEEKLSPPDIQPEILVSTVYTLVHIAAGAEKHRDLISQREGMLKKLLPLLSHQDAELRVAIVWLMINLTWIEEDYGSSTNSVRSDACKMRAQKIVELGFKEALKERSRDPSLDVRERTKTALFQIEGLLGANSRGGGNNSSSGTSRSRTLSYI